jgi:hypothetical protein
MKLNLKPYLALLFSCVFVISCSSGTKQETNNVDSSSAIKSDTSKQMEQVDSGAVGKSDLSSEKDWALIPGQAAGKTLLNEDAAQAIKTLGPADGGDAAMQKSVMIWYNNHDTTANSIAVYTARDTGDAPLARIKQIRVTSRRFKTSEGIHTSSTLTEIKQKFEVSLRETYKDEGETYQVYSSKKGIAFETDAQGNCVAIIIFDAGKPLPGTYLKFRTTNKFFKKS